MWLYDDKHIKLEFLSYFKERSIVSVLSTGDKTLTFSYPLEKSKNLIEENYIRTETDEFVIKQTKEKDNYLEITAKLNVEELEGKTIESFKTTYKTIKDTLDEMLIDTNWQVDLCNVTKKRTVEGTLKSVWSLTQSCIETFNVELEYDTLHKKINVFEKRGDYKGVFVTDGVNMSSLEVQSSSYDFYTRLIPIGKDGLDISKINNGKNYVENHQYSNKIKTYYWKDERYTIDSDLKDDAILKLEEMSQPSKSYDVTLIDLAKMNKSKYKCYEFSLGDIILLVSKEKNLRLKERIAKYTEYPESPEKNKVELSTVKVSLEDIQKKFKETTTTVNNITTAGGDVNTNNIPAFNEMAKAIENKVDKVSGKDLSTNDFTNDDKKSIHNHKNKNVLDLIDEEKVKKWDKIPTAQDIIFNNKTSNLKSNNVQDAIIEIYNMLQSM